MAPRNTRKSKTTTTASRSRVLVVPAPEDLSAFDGAAEPLDVDAEAHLRWLETGEGEPWPPASSS